MAVQKGDPAPPIKLPAKFGEEVEARIGHDKVVLLFFPLAFSPVCTDEMCHMRDTWTQWEGLDAQVLGISVDSPFVTDRFRADQNIPFPILSDFNKNAAANYGVLYEDLKGLKGVAKRSAFVIGSDGKVAYSWVTEDPTVQVPFEELKAALEK
ncbi:MAG: redoxin domain-containing protein [Planctomycetota bacterium]|jgi:peroxiredoxin